MGFSDFRMRHLKLYDDAYESWLRDEAEVVDTTHLTPHEAAQRIAVSTSA